MKPILLDSPNGGDQVTNYADGQFSRYYEFDGVVYYFSIFSELVKEEDGLDFTGRQFVVLLHPLGLTHFYVHFDDKGGEWESSNSLKLVDPEIIEMISDAIQNHSA